MKSRNGQSQAKKRYKLFYIPPKSILESVANLVRFEFDISAAIYISFLSLFLISILTLSLTRKLVPHLVAILVVTFTFAQLSLGDKEVLISAGAGMRYFAAERVIILWLLLCVSISNSVNNSSILKRISAVSLAMTIASTSMFYYDQESLHFFGFTHECNKKTQTSLEKLIDNDSDSIEIPICPNGMKFTIPNRYY